jgi:xanthine dehydrogenase YagR molybdenum-binding subunit
VRFELGDTTLPRAPLSAGSMTMASVGSAVKLACAAVVDRLAMLATTDRASPLFGLRRDELAARGGALVALADAGRREPLGAIVARTGQAEVAAEVKAEERPERERYSCHAFGADFVEVRVDEDLGTVRVARMVAAFAAGKIVNPKTARSQLMGGLVWAIGMALEEQTVRDRRTARVVTRDLVDYHVPVAADVPEVDVIFVDEVDPNVNELGVKGVGEIGLTGATAAIANAVFHATGRRIRELPITIEKLL